MARLYPQMKKVVLLLSTGLTCKEAAYKIGIRPSTARAYAYRARQKLGYATIEQMMWELGRERGHDE